jgi:hypothetical protein
VAEDAQMANSVFLVYVPLACAPPIVQFEAKLANMAPAGRISIVTPIDV